MIRVLGTVTSHTTDTYINPNAQTDGFKSEVTPGVFVACSNTAPPQNPRSCANKVSG